MLNVDIFTDATNYNVAKVFTWANSDLDGVGSVVLLGSMFPKHNYRSVFFGDFLKQFEQWWEIEKDNYDKVFIVGFPLDQSTVIKLDDYKIIFVSDNDRPTVYDSTLVYDDDVTSCTKLLYNKFKERIEFPPNLKKFFAYVNDYNSYSLKHEETKYLNALYRKSGSNRFSKFVKRFSHGFDGFTEKEVELAGTFFKELDNELEGLDLYEGTYKGFKIISVLSKLSVNEVAAAIIDGHDVDVVIVFNPDTQFVSFRKCGSSEASAKLLAESLCSGGGSDFAAGGKVTPKFLDFITKLKLK